MNHQITRPVTRDVTRAIGDGRRRGGGFDPATLFVNGELGFVYNAGNSATVWTNTAGKTPAAINDLDARIDDTSGNAANAVQATSGLRPLLSARRNLSIQSQDFTNIAWIKTNLETPVLSGSIDGVPSYIIQPTAVDGQHQTNNNNPAVSVTTATVSLRAKANGYYKVAFKESVTLGGYATFNLSDGTVITQSNGTGAITSLGGGEYIISFTSTVGGNFGRTFIILPDSYTTGDPNAAAGSFTGDGSSVLVAGLQLEPGTSVTRYQRVTTETDYDTVGFPVYLDFDEVDDKLTATLPDLGTDATVAYCTPYAAPTILTAQTIGAGAYDITTDFCARLAIDRALTVDETADLTAWLNTQSGYTP